MTAKTMDDAAGAPEASIPAERVTLLEFPRKGGYPERMTAASSTWCPRRCCDWSLS